MPENPILDYLTQYSGMTAVRLEGVTTRLADVQKRVQNLINYNTILVGHSLENDMAVLKVIEERDRKRVVPPLEYEKINRMTLTP